MFERRERLDTFRQLEEGSLDRERQRKAPAAGPSTRGHDPKGVSPMSTKNHTDRKTSRPTVTVIYESPPIDPEDIHDSAVARKETFARDTNANGVVVVDGGGLRIYVERGALLIEDGAGETRRLRCFEKATHGLSRIVILGSSGSLSIEALSWCRKLGIAVVVLSPDGNVSLSSTPRLTDDARLRRAQAKAFGTEIGIDLAKRLITAKLQGQAEVLAGRFDDHDSACTILELSMACDEVIDVDALRQLEASAASLYWQAWTGRGQCAPQFAARDRKRIPPHWQRYEGRRSVLASSNSNKKAERPVNAILNYCYACWKPKRSWPVRWSASILDSA